jgi:type II secretory pathway component PulF
MAYLAYKRPLLSIFILIPVSIASVILNMVLLDSKGLIFSFLLVPLILIVTLIAILVSKIEPDSDKTARNIAKWTLIILLLFFLSLLSFAIIGFWGILGVIFVLFFTAVLINYGLSSRNTTPVYVISTIGGSMKQNMPLATALEFATTGQDDNKARILRRIRKWLVEGFPLSEAIKRGYPRCPGYVTAIIAVAEKFGQVPSAVEAIEKSMMTGADEKREWKAVHPFYPVILMIVILYVIGVMTRFVIPKFAVVLGEMTESKLPLSTQILVTTSARLSTLINLVVCTIIFIIVPLSIYIFFRPRRPQRPFLISKIGDYVKWHIPLLHWFDNNYSMSQTIEILRLSIGAGNTIDNAVEYTTELDINYCFRKKLKKWLERIRKGENISASAKQSGLPEALSWAFDQSVNKADNIEILNMLSDIYRSNYSYKVHIARFIFWPCLIISIGLLVGFVVYSFFAPLIAIISSLSETII